MSIDRFRRAQYLLYAAVEQPPSMRARFLREACGEDGELLAEAERLLKAHREGDSLLKTSTMLVRTGLSPGDSVGPYRIVREIGRGGMGVVYLAQDTRLGREVAVKALAPELLSNQKQRERFRREAALAASLSHPGIATIHALEEQDGFLYIVSEYVRGQTLAEIFAAGPLNGRQAVDLGLQLSEALAAAHEKGVVHRDLKPENIIRNNSGAYKILDFGVAIVVEKQPSQARLTDAGTLVGTPAYMSPEQLQGADIDGRSDLFALGMIVYEGLAGRHPFHQATFAELMAAILREEPPPLTGLEELGRALEPLVRRCLRKKPADRHGSAKELAADFERLKRGTHGWSDSDEPSAGPLHVKWWRVHQAAMMAFYVLIVAALWLVKASQPGLSTALPFFAGVTAAVTSGALRAHLLFTRRFNAEALADERRRVTPWVQGSDLALSVMLFAVAGAVFFERQTVAGALTAAAVINGILSLAVEPATTQAVFGRQREEGSE